MREDILRSLPPDVADWSVADVCFYVKSHGFPGESKLFEEQVSEIILNKVSLLFPILFSISFLLFGIFMP